MNQRAMYASNASNDPKNAMSTLFANESKILNQKRKEIDDMQEQKRQILKEMQEIRNKLKRKSGNPEIFPESLSNGYSLDDFSHSILDDGSHSYIAYCRDSIHPFKISVTLKDGRITDVDGILTPNSALQEIRKPLLTLKEEKCPQLLLITIQQFITLNNFRNKVIQKLMSMNNIFRVDFSRYDERNVGKPGKGCTIIARKWNEVIFELRWTIFWDEVHQMLLHCFNIAQGFCNPGIKHLVDHLVMLQYGQGYEDNLMKAWDSIIGMVNEG